MGFRRWYNSQRATVQGAVVGGVFVVLAGAVTGAVTGAFNVIGDEIAKPAAQAPTTAPASALTTPAPTAATRPAVAARCPSAGMTPVASTGGELSQPDAIAVDGTHVWVANLAANTVTELDASDGSLVRVLSGGPYGFDRPRAIAVAGSHVWVANSYSSTVTELNASDGSLVRVISGFAGPNAIAATSTGVWVTSDGGAGGASVIELSAQDGSRVLPIIASSRDQLSQPDAIAVNGAHVWVASFCSNRVTELNASDGSLVRVLSGGPYGFDRPRAIAVAGSHVWVANSYSSTVTELNASDGSLVRVIRGFAGPNAIAATSTGVWVTSDGGAGGASVIELNASDGSRVLPIIGSSRDQLSQPDAIAVTGARVWVANAANSTVTELSTSDGSLVQILPARVSVGTIANPTDDARLSAPQTIHAAGSVQRLQPGHHLLLFLQWNDQDRYWAGDLDIGVSRSDSWTGTACLGFPGNVTVWLVDLGPKGLSAVEHASVHYWRHGFPFAPGTLASDIRMLAYATVTASPAGPGCEQNLPKLY